MRKFTFTFFVVFLILIALVALFSLRNAKKVNLDLVNKSINKESDKICLSKDTSLSLIFYRKQDNGDYDYYDYFVDSNQYSSIYYRTLEKDKFTDYEEGNKILVCASHLNNINPPEKYLIGVKDYSVLITREISDIDRIIILPEEKK